MKYKLNPDVVLVSVLDENMLAEVNTAAGGIKSMRTVNSSGAYFWKLLEEGLDTDDICTRVSAEFSVSEDIVRPSLADFMGSLHSAGYLSMEEQPERS